MNKPEQHFNNSVRQGYKGPGSDLYCKLPSSEVFKGWLDSRVDIATNLCWDTDTKWIRPDSIVICTYAGEYVDLDFIKKLDQRNQPIIVVTPLSDPGNNYKNVIWHQMDFVHYDSLYFKSYKFKWEKNLKFSCLNRLVRSWKYIGLGFFISVLGDKLSYTCHNYNFDQSEEDTNYIIDKIESISNFIFKKPAIQNNNENYQEFTITEQWQYVEPVRNSYYNITSESFYQRQGLDAGQMPATYITEKTLKPLAVGSFPVHFGQTGGYETLTQWGFTGFDTIIDTNYDSINDDYERLVQLLVSLDKLEENSTLEDVCYQNYRWFNDSFYDYVRAKNNPRIQQLKEIVNNL